MGQCCVGDAFQELLRVFNDILISGIAPSEIKDATITPLFKNGAQNLPELGCRKHGEQLIPLTRAMK